MAIRVEMKDISSPIWTDVTSRTVKANFKIREGFGTLGSGADLAKLTVTYKASDLAAAAVFHTTMKQVKVTEAETEIKLFEGYTEGSASVQTGGRSDMAWVKVTAYPYIKLLEDITNDEEIIVYDAWASNNADLQHSVLHILWDAMLSKLNDASAALIRDTYTISIPTIAEYRPIYRLDADSSLFDEFCGILGEFTTNSWMDGFTMRFSKPYADDERLPIQIGYTDIIDNPTIKTAPYKVKSNPVVTIAQVKERANQSVYKLNDGTSEDYQGIKDIAIGETYPEEGVANIAYSIPDESDTLEFYYAYNPTLTYEAFKNDVGTQSVTLTELVKNVGGTEAEVKFQNNNDTMVDISQISIESSRVFVLDKSVVIDANREGEDNEIETRFINNVDSARNYLNALVSEQLSDTASISFQSEKLAGIKPNDIIQIGDIPASYIVKYIETDILTGLVKYECKMFELEDVDGKVKTLLGARSNKGAKGKDGTSVKFEYAWSSSADAIDDDVDIYTWDGATILINGISIGNMGMDEWEKLVSTPPEGKPFLWVKMNDGAEFRLTGKTGAKGDAGADGKSPVVYAIKSVNPQNPIRNTHINGTQTLTLTAEIQNVQNASPVWTIDGSQVGTGTVVTYSLPYNRSAKSFTVGLYDGSASAANKKTEMVVSMNDVTETPIYEGAFSSVSQIPSNVNDGYTHSFLWTGETGTYPIAGASVHMTKAYPVIWNGAGWVEQVAITKDNANSLFAMINDAKDITTNTGVWAWFDNLVAKTAAIEQLFSKAITLLSGGSIQSESYGSSDPHQFIIRADGSSEFDHAIVKNSVMENVKVTGDKASFECPSFAGKKSEVSAYDVSFTIPAANAETQYKQYRDSAVRNALQNYGMLPCRLSVNSNVRYASGMSFYDANYNRIEYLSYTVTGGIFTRDVYSSSFENKQATVTVTVGQGDVFIIKSIPTSLAQCTDSGQVYSDNGTLKIKP